jgi:glycosyltransferase involved in cell wall biosynthesis
MAYMPKANKVLMIIENEPVPPDGRVWSEAIALRDNGYQVCIISPKGTTGFRESYICIEGIHIYRYSIPTIGSKYVAFIVEYGIALFMTFLLSIKVLFRHGFDVIHAANPPDLFFMIGLFYRPLGKKFIFDQHDLAPEMFQVKFKDRMRVFHKLLNLFALWSYRTATLIITTNVSQKQVAMKLGHCAPNKVFVVRNGPDAKRLKPVTPEPELKRGRRFLLAYEGVMAIQDGVEYTLYALYELVYKRGRQDVSMVLMGDGDHGSILRALSHKLELDEYVNFTGWIDKEEILRYLTVADVGLSPDPQNGLNEYSTMIKTMEYMAMGKPIVAFDLLETRISAQEAALYAVPNSVEDFADQIENLLNDKELRCKMGTLGQRRIEEELSWEEHSKKNLLQAYETLFLISSKPLVAADSATRSNRN